MIADPVDASRASADLRLCKLSLLSVWTLFRSTLAIAQLNRLTSGTLEQAGRLNPMVLSGMVSPSAHWASMAASVAGFKEAGAVMA